MKRLLLIAGIAAATVGLAGCGSNSRNEAATAEGNAAATEGGSTAAPKTETTYVWPRGARIVEESGVVYRIEPGAPRVVLGPNDSRIVVEDGTRYRVDPGGTRVRIDPQGVAIDVPVTVGINAKGNPDVDVNPPRR